MKESERQKAKIKRQKAKGKNGDGICFHFCLLPFAFCLSVP